MPATYTSAIDGLSTSVAIKAPVRVATTANITLYGEQTINSIAVVSGDRVLVKDQTDQTQNGIYVASATTWTRAKDFDGSRDVVKGTEVRVSTDDFTTGLTYLVTTNNPIVIGTSNIVFDESGPFMGTSLDGGLVTDGGVQTAIETAIARRGVEVASVAALYGGDWSQYDYLETQAFTAGGSVGGAKWYKGSSGGTQTTAGTLLTHLALGYVVDAAGNYWHLQKDQIINVTQFGATGDGSTDDTLALQAAIGSVFKTIYVPKPTAKYVISSPLTATSITDKCIYGTDHPEIEFDITGNGSGDGISNILRVDGASNLWIIGLHLDAVGAAGETGSAAIQIRNSSSFIRILQNKITNHNNGLTIGGEETDCWVADNIITDCQRHAVRQIGLRNIHYIRNQFIGSSLELMAFNGPASSTTENITFDGNLFRAPGATYDAWICINAGTTEAYRNFKFINNTFEDPNANAGRAIYWENPNACSEFVFDAGNNITGFVNGISIALASDSIFSNSTIKDCRQGGLVLSGCERALVTGMNILDCDSAGGGSAGGVHLRDSGSTGCSGTRITSCVLTGNAHGARVDTSTSVGVLIDDNNYLEGNSSNAIYDAGTSTIYGNNVGVDVGDDSTGGVTTEVTLKTATIGANILSASRGIRVRSKGSVTGTNGTKTIRLKMGGTTLATISQSAGETDTWCFDATIIPVNGTTVRVDVLGYQGAAIEVNSYSQQSITTTSNVTVEVTGQCANGSDAVIGRMFDVELVGRKV